MQNITDFYGQVINTKKGTLSLNKRVPMLFQRAFSGQIRKSDHQKHIGEQLEANEID